MDYTSFNNNGSATPALTARWWTLHGDELASAVFSVASNLEKQDSVRLAQNVRGMRLYGNLDVLAPGALSAVSLASPRSTVTDSSLKLNVVANMTDTLGSKLAKNKPRPTFMTSAGSWDLQGKAKKLQTFIDGTFYTTELYRQGPIIFRDALVFGTGCLKIFAEEGKLRTERVLPSELMIDHAESIYGKPRQLHQKKYVSKDILKEAFPKSKAKIEAAVCRTLDGELNQADMVLVIESWHLPSGPEAKDGKHAISLQGSILMEETWDKDAFPFVFMKWSDRLIGFWGQSLAEQLQGLQLEINKTLKKIQMCLHLCAVPRVWIDSASKVVKEHISNGIGNLVTYSGTKPIQEVAQAVSPELFQHLENLYRKAFEIAGVSQLSAQAQKPAGLNSGAALREFNDIESDRFQLTGQQYEDFFLDCAKHFIRLAKEETEKGNTVKVRSPSKQFVSEIDWKSIDVSEDDFQLKMFPTSMLPQTPAGRLQTITEMVQAGLIPQSAAADLLAFPDLDKYTAMAQAASDNIEFTLEKLLYDGEFTPPDPYQDLNLGVTRSQQLYLYAQTHGAPEERLELLRRWHDQALNMVTPPAPPAPDPSQDPAQSPQAVPEARPTSALLPQSA